MARKIKDITNKKYGRLTVEGLDHINEKGASYWKCRCECGTTKIIAKSNLISGGNKSCGCLNRENLKKRKGTKYMKYLKRNEDIGNPGK